MSRIFFFSLLSCESSSFAAGLNFATSYNYNLHCWPSFASWNSHFDLCWLILQSSLLILNLSRPLDTFNNYFLLQKSVTERVIKLPNRNLIKPCLHFDSLLSLMLNSIIHFSLLLSKYLQNATLGYIWTNDELEIPYRAVKCSNLQTASHAVHFKSCQESQVGREIISDCWSCLSSKSESNKFENEYS